MRRAVGLPTSGSSPARSSSAARPPTGSSAVFDLNAGGRLARSPPWPRLRDPGAMASSTSWASFPMVPCAGRVRDAAFGFAGSTTPPGVSLLLARHPRHGLDRRAVARPARASTTVRTVLRRLAPSSASTSGPTAWASCTARSTPTVVPASIGWQPASVRRPRRLRRGARAGSRPDRHVAGFAAGITTDRPPCRRAGPGDDCFTGLRRKRRLRWAASSSCIISRLAQLGLRTWRRRRGPVRRAADARRPERSTRTRRSSRPARR